ncbi:MAG: hypothetical protein ABI238_00120 [Terrimesophilobacter sp.]
MSSLWVILAVIAVILLLLGGFVSAVKFLLWIGIILLVIAVIGWLFRYITGRRAV